MNKSSRKLLRLIILVALLSIPISISVSADMHVSESEPNDRRVDANEITFPEVKEVIIVNGSLFYDSNTNKDVKDFYKLYVPKDCIMDVTISYTCSNKNPIRDLEFGMCSMDNVAFLNEDKFINYTALGNQNEAEKSRFSMSAGIYYFAFTNLIDNYNYTIKFDYRPVQLTGVADYQYPSLENGGIAESHHSWETALAYDMGKEITGMRRCDCGFRGSVGSGCTFYEFKINEAGEYVITFETGDGNTWSSMYLDEDSNNEYNGFDISSLDNELSGRYDDYFKDGVYGYTQRGKNRELDFKKAGTYYLKIWGPKLYRFRIEKKSDYDARNNSGISTTNKSSSTNKMPVEHKPVSLTKDTTKPKKVTSLDVKNVKGKKAKLSWKRIKGVYGYQVQYALNKKFTRDKKTKLSNGNSTTIAKLEKKKTYYFKVRAYKLSGRKKVYGVWSKTKKVKIKK